MAVIDQAKRCNERWGNSRLNVLTFFFLRHIFCARSIRLKNILVLVKRNKFNLHVEDTEPRGRLPFRCGSLTFSVPFKQDSALSLTLHTLRLHKNSAHLSPTRKRDGAALNICYFDPSQKLHRGSVGFANGGNEPTGRMGRGRDQIIARCSSAIFFSSAPFLGSLLNSLR